MAKLVEINLEPGDKSLRQFGFIALGGFGLLALMAYHEKAMFSFGLGDARLPVTYALLGVAVLCTVFSFVYPKANWPFYVGLSVLFFPLGFLVSYVLLAMLFFCIIGPTALVVRLFAADPMQRKYDRAAKSYFAPHERRRTKASYFRQF
jgi:hypothetical protein